MTRTIKNLIMKLDTKNLFSLAMVMLCFNISAVQASPVLLEFSVLEERQHDARTFTQGLEIHADKLYESSGGYGKSFVRKMDLSSGSILKQQALPNNWFAEGLSLHNNQLFLLSWQRQQGLVLNSDTLKPIAQFRYQGQGWGLCNDGQQLIMSNGSATLQFIDPTTFKINHTVVVHSDDTSEHWENLNELEFAYGLVWANIWQSNKIIAIDPKTGLVKYQLDLSQLVPKKSDPNAVLNGIAFDAKQNAFWVTGKLWDHQYLIKLADDFKPNTMLDNAVLDKVEQKSPSD